MACRPLLREGSYRRADRQGPLLPRRPPTKRRNVASSTVRRCSSSTTSLLRRFAIYHFVPSSLRQIFEWLYTTGQSDPIRSVYERSRTIEPFFVCPRSEIFSNQHDELLRRFRINWYKLVSGKFLDFTMRKWDSIWGMFLLSQELQCSLSFRYCLCC